MYGKPNEYDEWSAKQKYGKEIWESFSSKEKRGAIMEAFIMRVKKEMY
jgi:hypothetical protein